MLEIILHGLGGQGIVTADEILAKAAFADGWQIQAFPFFGVERTGTPVRAFLRLNKEKITLREQIYTPDWEVFINEFKIKNKNKTFIFDPEAAKNIPLKSLNMLMLGFFAKTSGLISLKALEKVVKEKFINKKEIVDINIEAVRKGHTLSSKLKAQNQITNLKISKKTKSRYL